MIKPFNLLGLLALFTATSLYAEAPAINNSTGSGRDSAIIFRFVPNDLTFYSPFKGNNLSLELLSKLLNSHKQEITEGKVLVNIQGFCGSFPTEKENLRVAKLRTNQVKSYFITKGWMKEEYYQTQNHAQGYQGDNDVVAYIRLVYAEGYTPAPEVQPIVEAPIVQPNPVVEEQTGSDSLPSEQLIAERGEQVRDSLMREQARQDSLANVTVSEYRLTPWSVKTNLLYDAVLMPSLEVEYRFNERWSVSVEGTMAWWHNNGNHKYYQLATISPEVRYWFKPQGQRKGHYIGLFAGGGWYDLENGGTGYKGEGEFAGISYGYMFPVGRYFSFEAGIGVGYMHTNYEEYTPLDGHYVYQQTSKLDYFGPLKLKFAWVWNVGEWLEKKGGNKR